MLNKLRVFLLFCFYIFSGAPLYAQDHLIISAMSNTGATKPVSIILKQAYQRIGIDIKIEETPGKRSLFYANSGKTDGEAYRVKGLEVSYPNLVRIEVPVREENMYFYVIKGSEFNVQGWGNFPDNLILGYIRGTYFVEKAASEHHIDIQPSFSYDNLLRQLDTRRNDVIIMSTKGEELIKKLDLKNEIVRLEPAARSFALFHYLHKRNINLIPQITNSLKEMQANGQIQEINQQSR